jgi:hypothetical protein
VDNLAMLAVLVAAKGADEAVKLVKSQAELLRNRKRDAGTYLHDVAEALILWAASPGRTGLDIALPVLPEHLEGADYDGEPLESVVEAMVDGFLNFVSAFDPEFEASEMAVFNRQLGVAGTLDTIIRLKRDGAQRRRPAHRREDAAASVHRLQVRQAPGRDRPRAARRIPADG